MSSRPPLSSEFPQPFSAISSNERAPSDTPSDFSERRPVSLISTLSSGSGSSRDDAVAPPPSTWSSDVDVDPSPAEGDVVPLPEPDQRGRSPGLVHSKSHDREATPTGGSPSCRQTSPLTPRNMAPNPQLTYLDRVVMEIIESERMYVRDLRMIVEVSHMTVAVDGQTRPPAPPLARV